ncbi:MAG TPA: FkbM family methyltransferase [Nitrospirota bacterium]|nr:FkbM family methyltransferase [Nitrospirota bacterium]
MIKEIRYNSLSNIFYRSLNNIACLIIGTVTSHSTLLSNEKTIVEIYGRIMGRRPNKDELLHWNASLNSGISVAQIEKSLKASFEYDQLRSRDDVVLVHLPSFKLYCRSSDLDVGAQIIGSQQFEPHIASVLKNSLKPGHIIVDLGANIGYFSLLAATLVGTTGKVISFEPNAHNLRLLFASIVENGMKNILVFPLAASLSPQILRLQSFGSNGFLEAPTSGQACAQYVQAIDIDQILLGTSRIDMFKMDIEGFEPFALRGMSKIIERHRPLIVTEFSPWHIEHRCGLPPKDYLIELSTKGYSLSIIEPSGNIMPASDPDTIMKFWRSLQNDKMHLDIVARPD